MHKNIIIKDLTIQCFSTLFTLLFLILFVPFISVIITAHNRREFLLEAVNSALNQTLPKDEYEIIVVKNFENKRIDKFLEEHNVKNIVTKEEPLGAKIVKGVEESKVK